MRGKIVLASALIFIFSGASTAMTGETEQEIVNRYLKRAETKHTRKITWVAVNFTFNRINRYNDYNKFANHTSNHFSNTNIPWIGDGKSFGIEAGMLLGKRFTWSVGGEYWLKQGINRTGSFDYTPPDGSPTVVENLVSETQVWGIFSSAQCYLYNPPSKANLLNRLALRVGGTIGFYQTRWDLWNSYENLNLATSSPEGINTAFKGSAPGFSMQIGVDYPLRVLNFVMGVDFGYLYLNFKNVAWYNSEDEEIVATYGGTADSRVNLSFSGFRGKVELKRFFKW